MLHPFEVTKLDLDTNKRHFVVGDIHGRFDTFQMLLDNINYDPAQDVVYSVGDLIDRGPKSYETVEWFLGDNRYAIQGNHEVMTYVEDWAKVWMQHGGIQTLNSLQKNNKDIDWLQQTCMQLPWMFDVGGDDEYAFRVVHAELPFEWNDTFIEEMMLQTTHPDDSPFSTTLWSRRILTTDNYMNDNSSRGLNLDRIDWAKDRLATGRSKRTVFTGHTPTKNVIKVGDHMFIDTFASKTMTIVDALTKERYRTSVIDISK